LNPKTLYIPGKGESYI